MQPTRAGDLEEATLAEIARIARDRAPSEACGIIIPAIEESPQRVRELPNRHAMHHDNFMFLSDDLLLAIEDWLTMVEGPRYYRDIVIWHSHPAGGVGPSTTDLRSKTPDLMHLVVTLTDDEPIATWY